MPVFPPTLEEKQSHDEKHKETPPHPKQGTAEAHLPSQPQADTWATCIFSLSAPSPLWGKAPYMPCYSAVHFYNMVT